MTEQTQTNNKKERANERLWGKCACGKLIGLESERSKHLYKPQPKHSNRS